MINVKIDKMAIRDNNEANENTAIDRAEKLQSDVKTSVESWFDIPLEFSLFVTQRFKLR